MDSTLERIRQFSTNQYSNENRLNARIQIYDFCERKNNWHEWVFDNLDFDNVARVLELGCGNGILWKKNIHRVPENARIILSDNSQGMVDAAREALGRHHHQFEFEVIDACQVPLKDNSFQMIIANHMLYHIESKQKVFSEIDSLLTGNGFAYASTLSTRNLYELIDIVSEFNNSLLFDNTQTIQNFNLENGENILSDYFRVANSDIYQNDIVIKKTEPLILYLASCYSMEQLNVLVSNYIDFSSYLESVIKKIGEIRITNKSVLFKFGKK
ncbi:MAG: class I SAM-dependent methyltransferase [Dehalococcoidales bacterium]|nr:MAG: class I SAM-dependent methyltransferase [Dehalococcoidales bacterium]